MIDSTFRNIDRLFVLSFKVGENNPTRGYFDKYYMPLIEIKDFNTLIDNKPFLDQLVKIKGEVYEKLVKIPRNNEYATGNLLDYLCHSNYYRIIGRDLSIQANTTIPQQIDFAEKSEEDSGGITFFIPKKQQKTILKVYLNLLIVAE